MLTEIRWASMEDAARYLGVSSRTIRRRIADGTIPAKRFGPRLVRVDMTALPSIGEPMTWGGH